MSGMALAERLRRLPAGLVDVAVTGLAAVAVCVTIAASDENGTRPELLAYMLGVAIALPLLARRRWPALALVASAAMLLVYYLADYPAIGVAVPLAAATYAAVAAGHLRITIAVVGGLELTGLLYRALAEGESMVSVIGLGTVADISLLAAVILLAEAVASRRALDAESRERLLALDREREHVAQQRVQQERMRIARELHDILAHTVAVINVHAGVAGEALESDPTQARASLAAIRNQSRDATAQVKAALGMLRDGSPEAPLRPLPRLADLDELVAGVGVEGLDVAIAVSGQRRSLPSEVELTAYRVAQESLTNVVRHAHAGSVRIDLAYEPEALLLTVRDDGDGADEGEREGQGLAGMRERVQAIGGSLETGAGGGHGFVVRARLPTTGPR